MTPEEKVVSLPIAIELHKLKITEGMETGAVYAKCVMSSCDSDRIEWEYNEEYVLHDYGLEGTWILDDMEQDDTSQDFEILPAPDLAELGGLLPDGFDSGRMSKTEYVASCFEIQIPKDSRRFGKQLLKRKMFFADTEPNARAKTLIALRKEERINDM
jgi:hypothetical protein